MDPLSASRTGFSETGIMGSCHPNAIEGGNKQRKQNMYGNFEWFWI